MEVVELRCEANPRRMFARLLIEKKPSIVPGNLLEFACRDCERTAVGKRVLHRFNVLGELVETLIVNRIE